MWNVWDNQNLKPKPEVPDTEKILINKSLLNQTQTNLESVLRQYGFLNSKSEWRLEGYGSNRT